MKSSTDSSTDEVLLKRLGGGDVGAFDILFSRYGGSVVEYARIILGGNQAVAEDVAQIVWEKVYFAATHKTPIEKFKAWILTVTRNESLNYFRRSNRETALKDESDSSQYAQLPSDPFNLDDYIENETNLAFLKEALTELPERQRLVLCSLLVDDDASQTDLAQKLGMSREAFVSTIFRAKENLSKHLAKRRGVANE